jgi:DNA gyrase subunit A
MLALVDGVPQTMNLAELIGYYVDHQVDVVTRAPVPAPQRRGARPHRPGLC